MLSNTGRGCGRGRGVISSNLEPKQELRRPFANSVDSLETQIRNIDLQYPLNINASEFVSSFKAPSTSRDEFVPGQFDMEESETDIEHHASLSILEEAIYQLTLKPGRFGSIAKRLTQDLSRVLETYDHLEQITEAILENGINEPNFRYTGARLCDYLSLHLTVTIEGVTLRKILLQKCNSLFKSRELLLIEKPDRLRGFTLFLAELFQQLKIQVGTVFQRVSILGHALPQLVCR